MSFEQLVNLVRWQDAIDILAVAVVIYNLLLLIRGTRAVQILSGIGLLAVVYGLARWGGLPTLESILRQILIVLPIAIIVLFQHEIRRVLASFGRNPLFGLGRQEKVQSTFDEVVLAATTLSARRIGGLIVIERLEGLRNYVENGIILDAALSFDLLISIFNPASPLHDGAVIVQEDRIAAAACFLPLTMNPELSKEFGTRHRAALGISEEADAVALVISEETGTISVAYDGQMARDLNSQTLRTTLHKLLITDLYPQKRRAA